MPGVRVLNAAYLIRACCRGQLLPGQCIDAVYIAQNPLDEPMMPGMIRPPALVTEYMTAGSVRNALVRKAEFMNSSVVRVKIALDTARVSTLY